MSSICIPSALLMKLCSQAVLDDCLSLDLSISEDVLCVSGSEGSFPLTKLSAWGPGRDTSFVQRPDDAAAFPVTLSELCDIEASLSDTLLILRENISDAELSSFERDEQRVLLRRMRRLHNRLLSFLDQSGVQRT